MHNVLGVNHVGLVVQDQRRAEAFYVDSLGLKRHKSVPSWLHMSDSLLIHLIEIPEALRTNSLYHEIQHVAFQVSDLSTTHQFLWDRGIRGFQMDFEGKEKTIAQRDDALTFGIGTLFIRDPDGNLLEFLEFGKGRFTEE